MDNRVRVQRSIEPLFAGDGIPCGHPAQGSRSLGIKPDAAWAGPLKEQGPGGRPTPFSARFIPRDGITALDPGGLREDAPAKKSGSAAVCSTWRTLIHWMGIN